MAPLTSAQTLLSPAELSYLHSSLSLNPPIRPDSRAPTKFRPLVAETDILPSTNGSARICFADGTEAVVGVKAEVEKTPVRFSSGEEAQDLHLGACGQDEEMGDAEEEGDDAVEGGRSKDRKGAGDNSWVEMTIEIPGFRDDDAMPVFLAAMLNEALLASGDLPDRLWINGRFHWKLYIDVSSWTSMSTKVVDGGPPPTSLASLPLHVCICLSVYMSNCSHLDPTALSTPLLPPPSPLPNNPPRPPLNPPPKPQVRTRRRSTFRRRLGRFDVPLSSLTITPSCSYSYNYR